MKEEDNVFLDKYIKDAPIRYLTTCYTSQQIQNPDWVPEESEYNLESHLLLMSNDMNAHVLVAVYRPTHIDGPPPKVRIHIVERDGKPFWGMPQLWNYHVQHGFFDQRFLWPMGDGFWRGIDDNNISANHIFDLGNVLYELHGNWMEFPKETNYEMVLKLRGARIALEYMNKEIIHREMHNAIDAAQKQIANLHIQLERWNNQLNQIYEDGADAANLLEEHGYPVHIAKDGDLPEEVPQE